MQSRLELHLKVLVGYRQRWETMKAGARRFIGVRVRTGRLVLRVPMVPGYQGGQPG